MLRVYCSHPDVDLEPNDFPFSLAAAYAFVQGIPLRKGMTTLSLVLTHDLEGEEGEGLSIDQQSWHFEAINGAWVIACIQDEVGLSQAETNLLMDAFAVRLQHHKHKIHHVELMVSEDDYLIWYALDSEYSREDDYRCTNAAIPRKLFAQAEAIVLQNGFSSRNGRVYEPMAAEA